MTRKDYVLIAKSLGESLKASKSNSDEYFALERAVGNISFHLQQDNPKFSQPRFQDAVKAEASK